MRRQAAPQRPSRRFVRTVLLLRLLWLAPLTLIGLHYFLLNAHRLAALMFSHSELRPLLAPGAEAAAAGALLYFTWKIWKKTWLIVTDRLYPEKSALVWQLVWIALLLALPYWVYRG